MLYYLRRLRERILVSPYAILPEILAICTDLLQDKFDPFGSPFGSSQIQKINAVGTITYPEAKIHVLRGLIGSGEPEPGLFPFAYSTVGLTAKVPAFTGFSRGHYILPLGSDGVVDFGSETAGQTDPSYVETITGNICHAKPISVFAVCNSCLTDSETASEIVASRARFLLDDAQANFGSVVVPQPLSIEQKQLIDSYLPSSGYVYDLISIAPTFRNSPAANGMTYQFRVNANPSQPMADAPVWFAEVYGPNGVTMDGVMVQQDSADQNLVTVTVADTVQGDVVIHASYNSTSGSLVFGTPKLVVSRPVGNALTGIELRPSTVTLSSGDKMHFTVWGTYDNGQQSQLYIPPDADISYSSSATATASVDDAGTASLLDPGTAMITVSYLGFSGQSSVVVSPVPPLITAAHFGNISTRLRVGTSDAVLIGGFIVTGNRPKSVIVRAIGPSLTNLGISGALADPVLELHGPGTFITITNNNWRDTQQAEIEATGITPSNDLESAIVATLPPGAYTAIVRGQNNGTGVGLVEAYDLDLAPDVQLANISTRGFVDTGENVMIGGLIAAPLGATSSEMLVRAIGPSLTNFGVEDALQDPTIELHDGNGGLIAFNDNWKETQQAAIEATGIPPSNDNESAILSTLSPGSYTAIVRGKNNGIGVGLVEVYNLQ